VSSGIIPLPRLSGGFYVLVVYTHFKWYVTILIHIYFANIFANQLFVIVSYRKLLQSTFQS